MQLPINEGNSKNTRLKNILLERNISQTDFIAMVEQKTSQKIDQGRLSRILNGKISTHAISVFTASIFAQTLGLTIDEVVEPVIFKKNKAVKK